jgi:hypothetical protein
LNYHNSVIEEMVDFIIENKLSNDYMVKIGIPYEVVNSRPIMDSEGFPLVIPIYDYLDELCEQMWIFIHEEILLKDKFKSEHDIKLSTLLKEFNLPLCPFWINFCDLVKIYLWEGIGV